VKTASQIPFLQYVALTPKSDSLVELCEDAGFSVFYKKEIRAGVFNLGAL